MELDPDAQHPLLVTTQWLAGQIDNPELVLIDCGEPVAYRRAHIPGAVSISHHPYLKGANDSKLVMEADEFEPLISRLGVSNDSEVVLYDDNSSLHAARVWWVLERFGHTNVRVVDGGFNAWLAEGRMLTSEIPRPARSRQPSTTRTSAPSTRSRPTSKGPRRCRSGTCAPMASGTARPAGATTALDTSLARSTSSG